MMASCLYEGMVRHRRFEPFEFGFRVPIRLLYLDLDEQDRVFADSRLWSIEGTAPIRFCRRDHVGPASEPLADSIRRLIEARLSRRVDGPIRLLTSPRYFGLVFNPLSLYYCFREDGETLDALVAEVTNTPWGERHCYVLDLTASNPDPMPPRTVGQTARTREPQSIHLETSKDFHVSPFMEMAMDYDWRIARPGRHLTFSIRNELSDRPPARQRAYGVPFFQADLVLNRREISSASLRDVFLRGPFQSGRVMFGIYRRALRLALRRAPFIKHPEARWPRSFEDEALFGPAREARS